MTDYPNSLLYTKEHEWVRIAADGTAVAGITSFAQSELGDIVFVDLPKVGSRFDQFAKVGEIESVKTVSAVFVPVGGEVIEVNIRLRNEPELVNHDPYGEGWLVKMRLADPSEASKLLTADAYQRMVSESH